MIKILVMGSGLMGPAAAFNAMADPDVTHVTLCDMNQRQLDSARVKLADLPGGEKLDTIQLDLRDQSAASRLMASFSE